MTLPLLVAIVMAAVGYQAARRPVLRRLAIRDATRRPKETVLVIAGSLLGTALITGSLIVGDTLDASINATAFTQLGPIDEIVVVPESERAHELIQRLEARDDPRIDGLTSLVAVQASMSSEASGTPLAEPGAQLIELDLETAAAFGNDPAATGISGSTPEPGEVAITQDLAERLDVARGDPIDTFLYGERLRLTVSSIFPRLGLAGFWLGVETISHNAFVPPGTIDGVLSGGLPEGAVPPSTTILVSNRGDVEEGAALTAQVTDVIEEEIGPDDPLRVVTIKRERLEDAEAGGKQFGELFLGIGAFAIIAGTLLLVNIFVMLAEERKSQLGMLRAVGMRRSFLVRSFVIEGFVYALSAAIVGALLGIGVGWGIARLAAPIFGSFEDFSLELAFDIDPSSLIVGFCSGFLISMVTIVLTSIRISRINIIRAIRDLPEPTSFLIRRRTLIFGSLGAVLGGLWFALSIGNDQGWAGLILGPPVAVYSALPVLSRLFRRRLAVIGAATFGLLWGIFGNSLTGEGFFEGGEIFSFVLQGVLLTFSAVILLSQLQENLGSFLRKVAARNLPVRLGVAYPLARRFRTGLTLGMFALVIFTMTFIAVLGNIFGGQIETAVEKEGGFEVLATAGTSNPPSHGDVEAVDGVRSVAGLLHGLAFWKPEAFAEPEPWPAAGIDRDFLAGGPPKLDEYLEDFGSENEVWEALLEDDGAVVVPTWFLIEGGGGPQTAVVEIGDTIDMVDPVTGKAEHRKVIGTVENDFAFTGAYMSKASIENVLGPNAAPVRFYVETTPGSDPKRVAAELQGRFVENGFEADSFRTLIEDFMAVQLQFLQLMQAYLALGLLVGIAGLGVVMVRAVRDRRRQIGVLRSLGFVPRQVRRAFVLESGFVAVEGILVGTALALVTASQLIGTGEFGADIAFEIPWFQVSTVGMSALAASLLATAWPAQQASMIQPAVALRIAD